VVTACLATETSLYSPNSQLNFFTSNPTTIWMGVLSQPHADPFRVTIPRGWMVIGNECQLHSDKSAVGGRTLRGILCQTADVSSRRRTRVCRRIIASRSSAKFKRRKRFRAADLIHLTLLCCWCCCTVLWAFLQEIFELQNLVSHWTPSAAFAAENHDSISVAALHPAPAVAPAPPNQLLPQPVYLYLLAVIKIALIRCHILRLKCTKFDCFCGSATESAYSAPQTLYSWI